jgi:hypothetical protein
MSRDPLSAADPELAATPTGDDPPGPVEELLTLRLPLGAGLVGEVRTLFRFDPERPCEVVLTFHPGRCDEADWVLARALLRDGLHALSGQGDIKLWPAYCPCHGSTLHLALESPHGSALLEAPRHQVKAWLGRTYAAVSEESEAAWGPTDDQLAALLAEG